MRKSSGRICQAGRRCRDAVEVEVIWRIDRDSVHKEDRRSIDGFVPGRGFPAGQKALAEAHRERKDLDRKHADGNGQDQGVWIDHQGNIFDYLLAVNLDVICCC
uniref:(northern house mosquito) hypothetical protein n=1 Tax=Culex pipiens TaxID=7175 RepID=A0A8D8L0V4_CULPI